MDRWIIDVNDRRGFFAGWINLAFRPRLRRWDAKAVIYNSGKIRTIASTSSTSKGEALASMRKALLAKRP